MKRTFLLAFILVTLFSIKAIASDTAKLYNPDANVMADIKAAVAKAKKEGKFVLLQGGGNWCSWCIRFNKFVHEDVQLDSAVNAAFVVYHLNYSKENKNEAIFKKYGYAQRFGFPVFIVLDANGKRIHTQNSAYLEEGKGYSKKKVLEFFEQWSPAALDEKNYKD
jgi:thioredoxin-related protein